MSNLPPGVTEGMLPGNRPEDLEAERVWQEFENLTWDIAVKCLSAKDAESLFSSEELWQAVQTFATNQRQREFQTAIAEAKLDRETDRSMERLYTDVKQLLSLFEPQTVALAVLRVYKGEDAPPDEADAY